MKVCSECGGLTPAQRADCANCGARSIEAIAAEQEAVKTNTFIQALFTRASPFTFIFIGINVGVFALEWLAGGMSAMAADTAVLVAMGAKDASLIDGAHQYWRFVTAIFIHIGFLHLLFNNYALWIIGQEIERIYGSARFVMLYLVTGLVSTGASYYFNPKAISAGASGSIFGLFGVMAAFAIKYKKELPKVISSDIMRRIIPVIIINLGFGFSVKIVDNSAHIGGLLSGIALAFIIPYKRIIEGKTNNLWRIFQAICLVVIFVSFLAAFRSYNGPRLSLANLTASPGTGIENYFNAMNEADMALAKSIDAFRQLTGSQKENADVRPLIDSIGQSIRSVNSAQATDEQANNFKRRMLELLEDQKSALEAFGQSSPRDWEKAVNSEIAILGRYKTFHNDYDPWLKDFLERNGYRLEKRDSNQP